MIAAGATDYVQPSIVKIGASPQLFRIATDVREAGVTACRTPSSSARATSRRCHCIASKDRDARWRRCSPMSLSSPYAKTVPDMTARRGTRPSRTRADRKRTSF